MGKFSVTNLPVGFCFPIINSNVVPTGCLEANGALISKTTYANLFSGHQLSLGTLYGDSGGDFYLPDFRGRVPRGRDNGSGRDPDAAGRTADSGGITGDNVGSMQLDEFESHNHGISDGECQGGNGDQQAGNGTNSTSTSTGGNETRGKNFNVMWVIKF